MQFLVRLLFQFLAYLPLPILHLLGNFLGYLAYWFAPKMRERVRENLKIAKIVQDYQNSDATVKSVLKETMKGALELPIAWLRSPEHITSLFKEIEGWDHVQAAIANEQGLLFITPHLGSYDLAGRAISCRLPFPLTAMFRPPKLTWMEPIMVAGRMRDNGRTATADGQGVRTILKALRNHEATIVLPDQVPTGGDGIWAKFWGKDAYSMTLAGKLAGMKNVQTFFFVGERLPKGRGFKLIIEPMATPSNGNREHDTQIINDQVESLIRRCPTQYLFSYNRFKIPAGANTPPEDHPSTDTK